MFKSIVMLAVVVFATAAYPACDVAGEWVVTRKDSDARFCQIWIRNEKSGLTGALASTSDAVTTLGPKRFAACKKAAAGDKLVISCTGERSVVKKYKKNGEPA